METPPNPLEGQAADAKFLYDVAMESVDYGIWTGTGGTDGCAQCSNKTHGIDLSFKERIAKGHLACAEEGAAAKAARSVRYGMSSGSLMAALLEVVADPRLGEWKRHLDGTSARARP